MALDENPYAPPTAMEPAAGIRGSFDEDLQGIAVLQNRLLTFILLDILMFETLFVAPRPIVPWIALGLVVVDLAGRVFGFLLALKVFKVGLGIVIGLLGFIPTIPLIVLLLINFKAKRILMRNEYPMGFVGTTLFFD
jgi:hypothetical protein